MENRTLTIKIRVQHWRFRLAAIGMLFARVSLRNRTRERFVGAALKFALGGVKIGTLSPRKGQV